MTATALAAVTFTSAALGLTGCTAGATIPPRAPASKTFTFRLLGDPETLDWNRAHTPIETYLLTNLMEGLVAHDSNLKVVPALAERWTKSADGRTYTFKIRKNVKWTDGVTLKAQDFVYSWKRLISPLTAASYAYFLFDIENAEAFYKGTIKDFSQVGIKAVDDLTLEVKLAKPMAHFIHIPSFWVTFPLRQDIVEKHGNSWAKPGRMVTLGPYLLSSYDIDSKVILTANPTYYGTRGNVEQAVGLIVKEDSTALTLYETGKIDFLTDISAIDLQRLKGRPDLKTFPYLKTGYLAFSINKFPVNPAKVRRAIVMAIDRSKLPEILHGGQTPATSFIPPKMLGYNPKVGLPFNPGAARAELRTAGLDASRPIKLELVCPNTDKAMTIAQYVQIELKKNLGVNLQIQSYDHKTFRAQIALNSFPVFINSWSADYPDPDNFMSVFLGVSGNNRTAWKSPAYDEKILQARTQLNPKIRDKLYDAAQKILLEDEAVLMPLYYEPNMALVSKRASSVELNPLNDMPIKKVILAP